MGSNRGDAARLVRAFSSVALVFAVVAVPASGAGTLDQSQILVSSARALPFGDVNNPDPNIALAQTFTAGITGGLDQVDLFLSKVILDGSTGTATLAVEIRTVADGVPSATVLASATVAETDIPPLYEPAWVAVPFPVPAPVKAGVQYAIVLIADGGNYQIGNAGDTYAGGRALYRMLLDGAGPFWFTEGVDLTFKTYVIRKATEHCRHHHCGH